METSASSEARYAPLSYPAIDFIYLAEFAFDFFDWVHSSAVSFLLATRD
jgi:hypothetical protein